MAYGSKNCLDFFTKVVHILVTKGDKNLEVVIMESPEKAPLYFRIQSLTVSNSDFCCSKYLFYDVKFREMAPAA